MKKIILAFAGTKFSESIFNYAQQLNERQLVLLVGVFLPEVIYSNIYSFGTGLPGADIIPVGGDEDMETIQKNMDRFADQCQKNGISYRVHKDYNTVALPELRTETRFADLLIMSSENFFDSFGYNDPNPSVKEALHSSECPVIIVPEKFTFPERNILAYDGSASSVYAIKQFAYLFPELSSNETLLVYAKDKNEIQLPEESNIEELASQHFKNLELLNLQINPKKYFTSWLTENKNALLIGGSFGRSLASELFRKSFVGEVINEHKIPVFIAHR